MRLLKESAENFIDFDNDNTNINFDSFNDPKEVFEGTKKFEYNGKEYSIYDNPDGKSANEVKADIVACFLINNGGANVVANEKTISMLYDKYGANFMTYFIESLKWEEVNAQNRFIHWLLGPNADKVQKFIEDNEVKNFIKVYNSYVRGLFDIHGTGVDRNNFWPDENAIIYHRDLFSQSDESIDYLMRLDAKLFNIGAENRKAILYDDNKVKAASKARSDAETSAVGEVKSDTVERIKTDTKKLTDAEMKELATTFAADDKISTYLRNAINANSN